MVEAEAGQIGGGTNHEFMARAEVGEDLFVECEHGDYIADLKAARPMAPDAAAAATQELTVVDTPDTPTIETLAALLDIDASQTLKCVLFDVGGRTVAVLVPGDREVNEAKLEQLVFPATVRMFEDEDFARRGFAKGYVGPQGFDEDVTIYADHTVRGGRDWVTGSNQVDRHVTGANAGRDFRVDAYEDLVVLREGDACPVDGGQLHIGRSIVVGHIYQLGKKYSEPLEATFTEEDGSEQVFWMGCYGIGISRILAAAAEQCHDEDGLTLPKVLAPFEVVVILANHDDEQAIAEAERIYDDLTAAGVGVALDDREERAGVKFADADLIGYPVQVTVGKRGIANGTVDLKLRVDGGAQQRTPGRGAPRPRSRSSQRHRRPRSGGAARCLGYTDLRTERRGVSGGGLAPTFSYVGEGRAVDAEALVRPVIEQAGFEFVELATTREHGRKVLRVVVDRPGGVDLDALSQLSATVSRHLDQEGYEDGPYGLEVSSPGIERPLKRPEHFARSVGEQVKVKTTAPMAGSRTHTGTLVSADEDAIVIATADGDEGTGDLRVPYADIVSARTVVDWDAELKRSNA